MLKNLFVIFSKFVGVWSYRLVYYIVKFWIISSITVQNCWSDDVMVYSLFDCIVLKLNVTCIMLTPHNVEVIYMSIILFVYLLNIYGTKAKYLS